MKLPPPTTSGLAYQSDTLAYGGQMSRARELTKREVEEYKQAGRTDAATEVQAEAALREALVGNITLANRVAHEALNLTNDGPEAKYSQAVSAVVFGLAGDSAKAARMGDELERRFPENTQMRCHYLPMIRGVAAMKDREDHGGYVRRVQENLNRYTEGILGENEKLRLRVAKL